MRPIVLVGLLALVPHLCAQITWSAANPTPRPGPRYVPGVATDTLRGITVLFGGVNDSPYPTHLDDTWEWDGAAWTARTPAVSPAARAAQLVFDEARGVIVMFGGGGALGGLNDTWTYDGVTWTQAVPVSSPGARAHHGLAYDAARQRVIVFGGYGPSGEQNDTWEWDGVNWAQVATATVPSTRHSIPIAYDRLRQEVVLFGGSRNASELGDTWIYDGIDWTQRAPAASPSQRSQSAMIWSPATGSVVLAGGYSGGQSFADAWSWDGQAWLPFGTLPDARRTHRLALDPDRNVILAMDGTSCNSCLATDSQFESNLSLASFTPYGTGCSSGTLAAPLLTMPALPVIGTAAQVRVANLQPHSLAFLMIALQLQNPPLIILGLPPGCLAYVDPFNTLRVYFYISDNQGVLTLPILIPNRPGLAGVSFAMQWATPVFSLPDPLPFLVSNGGVMTVGF